MNLLRLHSVPFSQAVPALILVAFSTVSAPGATTEISCKPLGENQRAKLVDYVKKQYKLAKTASLTVSDQSLVSSTCFRKLEFKSNDPKQKFRTVLFLSPDFRFLTPQLLDSSVDPIVEERRRQQALESALNNGNFPSRGPKD